MTGGGEQILHWMGQLAFEQKTLHFVAGGKSFGLKWMCGDSKSCDTAACTWTPCVLLWSRVIITAVQSMISVSQILWHNLDHNELSGCSPLVFHISEPSKSRFRLDIWNKVFNVRMVRHWHKLPRDLWLSHP